MRRSILLRSKPLRRSILLACCLLGAVAARGAEPQPLSLYPANNAPGKEIRGSAEFALAQNPRDLNVTWDLSRFDSLYIKVKNLSDSRVAVRVRAENTFARGVYDNCRTASFVDAHAEATLRLRLMRRPQDPTYVVFKPYFMYFKDLNVRDNTVDPSYIARIVVWLDHPEKDDRVEVESIVAQGEGNQAAVPFFPFVDKYGQYKHTDWPDKVYSDDDFVRILKKDQDEMAQNHGPADWDPWGGWANGPKQKATGFFYPAKVDGKWWLVDPDGALFWSYGPTGVNAGGEGSPVTGKETWFEDLPAADGPYAKYWSEGVGARYRYYADGNKPWKAFNFAALNAERKYGANWRQATADALHARLRNWGFNTMGNWSDPVVYLQHKTPYVVYITSGAWSLDHIPDVFDPRWSESVNAALDKEKDRSAGDPWNIGYFIDNELTWGGSPRATRVTQGVIQRGDASSPTKIQFINDLKAKYNDIAQLNKAWNSKFASWDALLQNQAPIEPATDAYRKDAGDFGEKFAEKYFSTCRDAIQRVAPSNLYLGCRFHGNVDKSVVAIAAKYCDVIGYNVYDEPKGRFDQYLGIDKPFIVGEFGLSSDLGQTPWRGKIFSEPEGDRLKPMETWLSQAFAHPSVVGAHFFQFRDQPLTGREDGEATLRGFLNIADAPHFDLIQLNRRYAYHLYDTRSRPTTRPTTGG